ncbi:MAG TPA: 50S ribosomal protein L17, partial [Humibacillus xanthopallidus]|nr:50S ribosomal protein L17 [Humibacillus xanthopallidus]
VVIELVREPLSAKKATVKEAEGATRRAAKQEEAKAAAAETKAAEDAEKVESTEATEAAAALPEGAVAANEDGSSPDEAYTVKGNADSGKYHEADGQWYDQTIAEFWFKSAEDAEKAGFTKAGASS